MVKTACSLYFFCLCKVAELLVKCQRKGPTSTSDNPFRVFPPTIVNDLIPFTLKKAEEEKSSKSSCLHLLLISGRMTSFKLADVEILFEDAEEIFNYLQPYSDKLRSINISLNSPWVSSNFGTLLRSAKNLVSLETTINFNLSELSSCINLQKLTLDFEITDCLSSFLHVGDEIRYNHSLKILRILKISENKVSDVYLDIAEILQYCVEIIEIEYDVSQSLVYLHENQKATKYTLQKTYLGKNKDSFRISSNAVQIASLYCPDLRVVVASTAGYLAIETLSNFRHITNLILEDPEWPDNDFNQGVRPLLENSHFGHNLTLLILTNFSEVDFSCIGACCPNLKELGAEYVSEKNQSEFTTNSFHKLISLYLNNVMGNPCERDSIIGILSKASLLEFLTIRDASRLNDTALDAILKKVKAFPKLKTLIIDNGGLTSSGLNKLFNCTASLEYVSYT